jgi:hypothetical protein
LSRAATVLGAVGLVLLGVVVGAVLDAVLLPAVRRAQFQRQRRGEMMTARTRDPKQWREDSARLAEWEARQRDSLRHSPREVRRVQALAACAVSFEFRDTTWKNLALMRVRAWDRHAPGVVVAEGWTYREPGFNKGDTATVVLPNIYCGDLLIGSYGASRVVPRRPPRLDVR